MKSPSRARFTLLASVAAALLVASCQTIEPKSLGNKVWLDENENGIQNSGERGVSGVIVGSSPPTGHLSESKRPTRRASSHLTVWNLERTF